MFGPVPPPTIFVGKVEINKAAQSATIVLDGGSGTITLGGIPETLQAVPPGTKTDGINGQLTIKNAAAFEVVAIGVSSAGGAIQLSSDTGKEPTISFESEDSGAFARVGGNGVDGEIGVFPKRAKPPAVLSSSRIPLGDTGFDQAAIHLKANGHMRLGSSTSPGQIVVAGTGGPDDKSYMDLTNALLKFFDKAGNQQIFIDGQAGNITVNGDITLAPGVADFAEDFDISDLESPEPGTVMVIDQTGSLRQSDASYDRRVAGIISGAGDYKPGIILDRNPSLADRRAVALVGKVYCKVDARYSAVEVGDLLTTSPTPGHAMKAEDQSRAFGSVIGKALRSLTAGQGLIPVLIALQ